MKYLVVSLIVISSTILFGQNSITDVKGKPCYERAGKSGNVDVWQCGKEVGVVNCNEELEVDEGSGLVIKRATDNVNYNGVGKPFTGKCESCFMNGLIERRITFVNGKEEGTDTSYYESGCPQAIRTHIQGEESGTWTYFYDSTQQIAWEMNFYMGEKNGKDVYMKPNGDTTKEETYKNGLLHGVKKSYYKGSKIFKEATYANGLLDGSFKLYNNQGIVIEEVTYKQGKKNEVSKYFYDDGVLLRTENWSMGVKNGEFKTFYYQGHVQTLETYKKGVKEGKFAEFYPDQKEKRRAFYEKDVLIEEHLFDEQGNETYSFGAPVGDGAEDDAVPGSQKKGKKK